MPLSSRNASPARSGAIGQAVSAALTSTPARPNLVLERLEERRLLTRMVGGEFFEYQDLNGNAVRVGLQGNNASVELIGASLDADGFPRLNQIPGVFVDAAGNPIRDIFGGYGGADGVEPVTVLQQFLPPAQQGNFAGNAFTDINRVNAGFGPSIAARDGTGNGNINITALAAKSTGQTFGFNVSNLAVGDSSRRVVELVSISNYDGKATVGYPVSEIATDILTVLGIPEFFVPPPEDPENPPEDPPEPEDQRSRIESITSADFDSLNDRFLFFVADVTRGGDADPVGGEEEKLVSHLMYFDALTGDVVRVTNFGSIINSENEADVNPVSAISFLPNGNMLVWGTRGGNQTGLFTLTRPFGNDALEEASAFTTVRIGTGDDAEAIDEISAMEVIPYDAEAVYIISEAVLYRVQISNGTAVALGDLPDPDDEREGVTARGTNLNALVWNPALPNFFADRDRDLSIPSRGVLLAVDTVTDELVVVDQRERVAETNLFRVEGLSSNVGTSLRIAQVNQPPTVDRPSERVLVPFAGTIGTIATLDEAIPAGTAAGGTGSVLIGIRSQAEDFEDTLQNSLPLSGFIGAIPSIGLAENVRPGVFFPNSIQSMLVGGTISGDIRIVGSADTIYAGNILTGDAGGLVPGSSAGTEFTYNFRVDGDVRNVLVAGGIGSTQDPRLGYRTGTDMFIGGRMGQIRTGAGFSGSAYIFGDRGVPRLTNNQTELETFLDPLVDAFQVGVLETDSGLTQNDTFETAQLLYTAPSGGANNDVVVVDGTLQQPFFGDITDFYGVPLIAGQQVEFNLVQSLVTPVIGVFDPDGRIIYTTQSNDNPMAAAGESFRFTAERPGIYRIAISANNNVFGGDDAPATQPSNPYTFALRNVNNLVFGGLVAGGGAHLSGINDYAFLARRGDVGAFDIQGSLTTDFGSVNVLDGNFRSIQADDIGAISEGFLVDGLVLNVSGGSVGLLQTNNAAATGLMYVGVPQAPEFRSYAGLDFQHVDAASLFIGNLQADRGIGNILAGNMTTSVPPEFVVNADRRGNDGFINLIDVTGDFGTLAGGGPRIVTNEGGNVRYIRVGGEIFRDQAFGGGVAPVRTVSTGEDLLFQDDSGSSILFEAGGAGGGTPILLPGFAPPPSAVTPGSISFTSYPIFGSGGSVIVNATLDGNVRVKTFAEDGAQSAEISQLTLLGTGAAPVDLNGRLQFLPTADQLRVTLEGTADLDLFEVTGNNINNLINRTNGEILNVSATTIGTIRARSIGVESNTRGPMPIVAQDDFLSRYGATAIYPFNDQQFGIYASDSIVSLEALEAVGNVFAGGNIQRVEADADGRNVPNVFEGITGPIVSENGEIREVLIGDGIAYSGSGNIGRSGIYAAGPIGTITGNRVNADIRGDIISATSIGQIVLRGGSIIGADILVVTGSTGIAPGGGAASGVEVVFLAGQEFISGTLIVIPPGTVTEPGVNLGPIRIGNGGGIMGAKISGGGIGLIDVMGGYGVFNSIITSTAEGYVQGIRTDGLGIRNTRIVAGSRMDWLVAEGTDGRLLNTTSFSSTARPSDTGAVFDTFTGRALNFDNDLNAFLGTSALANRTRISGVTNQGIIDNVQAVGDGELGRVQAFQIQGRSILDPSDELYPMQFSFGESVTSIRTFGPITGLRVLTGGTREILSTSNIDNLWWEGSGLLRNIEASGTIEANSFINAKGVNGRIEHVRTGRDLRGTVRATKRIGTVNVGRNLGSQSLETSGRIDNLRVANNVLAGTFVRARTGIGTLFVGGDISARAAIRAGAYGTVTVNGVIGGDISTI